MKNNTRSNWQLTEDMRAVGKTAEQIKREQDKMISDRKAKQVRNEKKAGIAICLIWLGLGLAFALAIYENS